jgi:formylglycine-generating enzyme required for sulfatase activity
MSNQKYVKCGCQFCSGKVEYPVSAAGREAPCPHCGRVITLPEVWQAIEVPMRAIDTRLLKIVAVVAGVGLCAGIGAYLGAKRSGAQPIIPPPGFTAPGRTQIVQSGSPVSATSELDRQNSISDTGTARPPRWPVAPVNTSEAPEHQRSGAKSLRLPIEITNSIGMRFVLIPPGEFDMGTSAADLQRELEEGRLATPPVENFYPARVVAEGPQHRVKITKAFYLGACEVTQGEYLRVMGRNPSRFSSTSNDAKDVAGKDTSRHPVEMVYWWEAAQFIGRLSAMPAESSAQRCYRLPTEAEWEYACRAETSTRWSCGNDKAGLLQCAWFRENSGRTTHPVGEKLPNGWGLHDMHGNVWEWCADRYTTNYYARSSLVDPQGPSEEPYRVLRGGGWERHALGCRSAYRGIGGGAPWPMRAQMFGFRVACEVSSKPSPN